VNWFLKFMIAAVALSAWIGLLSCAPKIDSDTYLQQEVSDLQRRTIPPDSRRINQHSFTRRELGASASWDFESDDAFDAYKSWVTSRLRPDFQARETINSRLRFSKDVQGDVETLSLETASSSGALHVAVKLEIYPD